MTNCSRNDDTCPTLTCASDDDDVDDDDNDVDDDTDNFRSFEDELFVAFENKLGSAFLWYRAQNSTYAKFWWKKVLFFFLHQQERKNRERERTLRRCMKEEKESKWERERERVSVLKFELGFGWFLPKAYFQLPVVALSKALRGLKKLLNALRKRNKKYLCFNFEWKRSRWKENGTTQS